MKFQDTKLTINTHFVFLKLNSNNVIEILMSTYYFILLSSCSFVILPLKNGLSRLSKAIFKYSKALFIIFVAIRLSNSIYKVGIYWLLNIHSTFKSEFCIKAWRNDKHNLMTDHKHCKWLGKMMCIDDTYTSVNQIMIVLSNVKGTFE